MSKKRKAKERPAKRKDRPQANRAAASPGNTRILEEIRQLLDELPDAEELLDRPLESPRPKLSRRQRDAWTRLPLNDDEVWRLSVRQMPAELEIGETDASPWMMLLINRTDGDLLFSDVNEERFELDELWEALTDAMLEPSGDRQPRRPAEIQVDDQSLRDAWHGPLEAHGVRCVFCDDADPIYDLADVLIEQMANVLGQPTSDASIDLAELAALPRRADEIWQADFRRFPSWLEEEGELIRPWMFQLIDATNGLILAVDMHHEPPTADWLCRRLFQAMQKALPTRQAHRPGQIQVRSVELCKELREWLEPIGVECVVRETLDQLDPVLDEFLKEQADDRDIPTLVEIPGVTLEQIGSLFEAAAEFYRRKPWRRIPGDTALRIKSDKFPQTDWHAVVMGQSGMTFGLAMYDDPEILRAQLSGELGEEFSPRISSLALSYGEAFELAVPDLDAAERHGWPSAGAEAYPSVLRVRPGRKVIAPSAAELELLDACLRAIPDFLAHKQSGPTTMQLPICNGSVSLTLSRVDD